MKRIAMLPLLLLVFAFPALLAEVESIDEGIEYRRLTTPLPGTAQGKVEIIELFWYGCPHCYNLQPTLETWREKHSQTIAWKRVPAVLSEHWALHARAYYTAEELGMADHLHAALFDAIHRQGRQLNNEASLATFFAEQGITKEDFSKTFRSFMVDMKLRQAAELTQHLQLDGVPAVLLGGELLTSPVMTGGRKRMIPVLDALLADLKQKGKQEHP